MLVADALATTLRDWGLRYLFGVSGANIEPLHDAVHRLGEGRLRSVCAKSEVGAAFMADGRARVHRTLGLCCSTSGGGMMNLAVGVAESFAESVPVLAVVGQPPRHLEGRGAFQDSSGIGRSVNATGLWAAISKHHERLDDPRRFWMALTAAVTAALTGRRGPVVLLVPRDVWIADAGPRPSWVPEHLDRFRPDDPPAPQVAALFERICAARAPALLLGSGVDRCSDPAAVVGFARRMGLPTATTLASKSAFPNDDPLYLGTVGMAGEPSAHRFLTEVADLVVAVGTGLSMMSAQPVLGALRPGRLAAVNIDMGELLRIAPPSVFIEADAGVVFADLDRLRRQRQVEPRAHHPLPATRFVPLLAPAFPDGAVEPLPDWLADDLRQSEALEILQRFLPSSGHVLFDAGNCAAAALHCLRIPPNTTATIALGMGGMGYAIAAAIGVQFGQGRDRGTVVLCGDGAFLALGTEVHTAVHYRLPILFVVFNNGKHGMCVSRQQVLFGGRIECATYPAADIAGVARGFGGPDRLWIASVGTAHELLEALHAAGHRTVGPGVLEIRLQLDEVPPFASILPANAKTCAAATGVGSR